MIEQDWTSEVPTKPGSYWFYGWFNALRQYNTGQPIPPKLDFIEVVQGNVNQCMYLSALSMQISGKVIAIGKWKLAVLPELPDLSEFDKQPDTDE